MLLCNQCGNSIPNGLNFCTDCGAQVGAAAPTAPLVTPPLAPTMVGLNMSPIRPVTPIPPAPQRSNTALIAGAMVLLLLLIGGITALYVRAYRNAQAQTEQERTARAEAERQRQAAQENANRADAEKRLAEERAAEAERQRLAAQNATVEEPPPSAPTTPTQCQPGSSGYLNKDSRLRSAPYHSRGMNVLATWKSGARMRVEQVVRGDVRQSTGRPYWCLVEITQGRCGGCDYNDVDCGDNSSSCGNKVRGYIHEDLISCN